jgi:hypothetical protein
MAIAVSMATKLDKAAIEKESASLTVAILLGVVDTIGRPLPQALQWILQTLTSTQRLPPHAAKNEGARHA